MGSTRDFVNATVADAMLPWFRRPVEDVIYETIDKRQIPTRTDFKELRDLVNNLRGQLVGATGGVKRLAETTEDLAERLDAMEDRFSAVEARLAALEARPAPAAAPGSAPVAAPSAAAPAQSAVAAGTPAITKACKVPDCDEGPRARGFCARHYQQWRRGTLDGFPNP
jgi:hypothetical protein